MTRIDFYHYAEDKLRFACRLATRAYEASTRLVVFSPDRPTLEQFDALLWSLHPAKFVPHCFVESALTADTPVILATDGEHLPHHDVLLNLGDEWPPFFSTFERLLEVVGTDDQDKARARERYTFYRRRGYEIKVNAIEAERREAH